MPRICSAPPPPLGRPRHKQKAIYVANIIVMFAHVAFFYTGVPLSDLCKNASIA